MSDRLVTLSTVLDRNTRKKIAQFTNRPLDHFVSHRELNNFFKANIICLVETKYRKHLCRTIIANHILSFTGLGSKGTPCSGGSRGGGLIFFLTKMRPEGSKRIFLETAFPRLSEGLDLPLPCSKMPKSFLAKQYY